MVVMKNKFFKGRLFLFALLVVIFFATVLYVQYEVGMHGNCPKCDSTHRYLSGLSKELYFSHLDKNYPESLMGFERPGYLKLDPWDNEYLYSPFFTNNFQCFVVWSFGSDGVPGGSKEHQLDVFEFGQCKQVDGVEMRAAPGLDTD